MGGGLRRSDANRRRFLALGNEDERGAVDAVSLPSRQRAVVEHVPEMRTAETVDYFNAHREEAVVLDVDDRVRVDRLREARPTATRLKLVLRAEQRLPGGGRVVDPLLLHVVQWMRERGLGALLPQYVELVRREQITPG